MKTIFVTPFELPKKSIVLQSIFIYQFKRKSTVNYMADVVQRSPKSKEDPIVYVTL